MTILPDAKLFIDGQLCDAEGGKSFDIIGPWTGEPVGKAADAGIADVERAIVAARRAFDDSDWSTNRELRVALVRKLYDLFDANRDRLSDLARHEAGAALGAVGRAHVDMAMEGWLDYLNVFPQVEWEKAYPPRTAYGFESQRRAVREPVGVVAAITPWNVPLYVNVGKVVAALLAGCTVILKPAPNTPGMGAIFGELAAEAGFPAGVLNVVFGSDPAVAGEALVKDPRVDLVSFTGSTGVGKRIMEQSAATLKRVFLQIGQNRTGGRPQFRDGSGAVDAGLSRRARMRGAVAPAGPEEPFRGSKSDTGPQLCQFWRKLGRVRQSRPYHGPGRVKAAAGPRHGLYRAWAGRRRNADCRGQDAA
jgi:aldehyde dehydrogenase (NAD+)